MPTDLDFDAALVALRAQATRLTTRMGEGSLVWHCWGEGAPVVLLHGGSGSWTHWVRNVAALAATGRRVYVPDLPGFGDSDPPPKGLDADAMPPWIQAGLRELTGNASCDLVGFSFGAIVAGFMAASEPSQVRRLILVGAPALLRAHKPALDLKAWNHLTDPHARYAAHHHNLLALMLADATQATEFTVALHSANLLRDRMTRRRISRTDILLRTLPAITCPVFGIWGEHDVLVDEHFDLLESALATAPAFRSLTIIEDAGHWVQYEAAQRFNEAVVGMLSPAAR